MATLQFKRGSHATLMNLQTVPAAGEPIWDKEWQRLKVGDGEHLYSELPYVAGTDDSSIVYSQDNLISLFGFNEADENSSPVKSESGILEWKVLATKEDLEIEAVISDEIQAEIDSINDYIDNTLKPQLEDIESEIDDVKDDVSDIKSGIIDIKEEQIRQAVELNDIKETLNQLDPDRIDEALETIEQYEDRLDDMQADIGQLKNDVEALQGNDENQDDTLADHEARIEALEQGGSSTDEDALHFIDGVETQEGESVEDALDRVDPEPHTGDIVTVNNTEYFFNGDEWKPLGIDEEKLYTSDDVVIIYGGSASDVIIGAHEAEANNG